MLLFFVLLFQSFFVFSTSQPPCPQGMLQSRTNSSICYSFQTTKVAFFPAEEVCLSLGGHLVSIHNAFDAAFLAEEAKTFLTSDDFWIGLNGLVKRWSWLDGSSYDYTDWDKGQPSAFSCAAATVNSGFWHANANDCTSNKPFVCEVQALVATTTTKVPPTTKTTYTKPAPKTCPESWKYFPETNSCYFVGRNKTWPDAEAACFAQGGHLASIHSATENSFIYDMIPFYPNQNTCHNSDLAWIGLYTVTNPASWMWTDDSPFDYVVWGKGRPLPLTQNHRCGMLWNGPLCGAAPETWADGGCSAVVGFYVCKTPLL